MYEYVTISVVGMECRIFLYANDLHNTYFLAIADFVCEC